MSRQWVAVTIDLADNYKVASLPSDGARFAFVVALTRAKVQEPPGEWANERHCRFTLGRYGRYYPALVDAGLLDVDEDGIVAVHDWESVQRESPKSAERMRRLRERRRAEKRRRDATDSDIYTYIQSDASPERHGDASLDDGRSLKERLQEAGLNLQGALPQSVR